MHYALPILLIALTIPAFFALGRAGFAATRSGFGPFGWPQLALRVLVAVILLGSAAMHFLRPAMYAAAIPPAFPYRYALALISGICEAAGAIGLFVAATRRAAAVCLAVFMVAIFPANIYIAGQTLGPMHMPGVPIRTIMQMIFILMVLLAGWGLPHVRRPLA